MQSVGMKAIHSRGKCPLYSTKEKKEITKDLAAKAILAYGWYS